MLEVPLLKFSGQAAQNMLYTCKVEMYMSCTKQYAIVQAVSFLFFCSFLHKIRIRIEFRINVQLQRS